MWKKRSIFFDLPYWSDLHVRHCLDIMQVEKNVYDILLDTLLNIKGKTKDGLKCRQDLVNMGIQEQLHPISQGHRTYLPPACHTMSTTEKRSFCQCLQNVKVPQGYSKYQEPCSPQWSEFGWLEVSWLPCLNATTIAYYDSRDLAWQS